MIANIRKLIRWLPIPAHIKADWRRTLIRREYGKEILELKKRGDDHGIEMKEDDRRYELQTLFEEQEQFYSTRLIQKARRLRVPVPKEPKWIDAEDRFEVNADWNDGLTGLWLTEQGIGKLREDIRKEERWRREGRTQFIQLAAAVVGIIGGLTGLFAVLLR